MVGVPGQPIITTQDVKSSLITNPVTAANGTKIPHFDFVVEDYRGFNISKGLRDNPTMGSVTGTLGNK